MCSYISAPNSFANSIVLSVLPLSTTQILSTTFLIEFIHLSIFSQADQSDADPRAAAACSDADSAAAPAADRS